MEIHSVLFNRDKVSTVDARKWLKNHNLVPIKPVHKTSDKLRYRIRDPALYKSFVSRIINPNVTLVFGLK